MLISSIPGNWNNDGGRAPEKAECANCSTCNDPRVPKISGSCPLKDVSKAIKCCKLTSPAISVGRVPVSDVPKSHRISVVKDRIEILAKAYDHTLKSFDIESTYSGL
jgi:hypothetical protein